MKLDLSFQPSRFSTWSESQDENLNILRTKRAFEVKSKAFFVIFKGLSIAKNCLRPESAPSVWTVQKQLSTAILFRKSLQKILVVESFLWSNYRLTVHSGDYILKWLHQERFLANLPKAFGGTKYHRLKIFEVNLFLVAKVTCCGCWTFANVKQIFP